MTKDNLEIDLIIERLAEKRILIEIKSTDHVSTTDLKALKTLGREIDHADSFVLSLDTICRVIDGVKVLHWKQGLKELGLVD